MSAVLDAVYAEMEVRARALLRRLHKRDKDRHWNAPLCWPGRFREPEPGEVWSSGQARGSGEVPDKR